jgi:hypothetical protein
MLTRRQFLASSTCAAVAIALDPERVLWVPGRTRIFIPAFVSVRPPWLPTGFLVPDGRTLPRAAYPDLFAVLGTRYGGGDDDSFRLPDLRSSRRPAPLFVAGAYVLCAEPRAHMPAGYVAIIRLPND